MTDKYRAGVLTDPVESDPFFEDEDSALEYATEKSTEDFSSSPYGVWLIYEDTGHAELEWIVFDGMWFKGA